MDEALLGRIKRRMADEPGASAQRLAEIIREEAVVASDLEVFEMMRIYRDDTSGAGPLEALLAGGSVTDICVNAPDAVFVDAGEGLVRSEIAFDSEAAVRRLATRLALQCGRRLDDAQPFCDGHLRRDDGTILRFHAVLAPTAHAGTTLSLRVLRTATATLDELVASGTMDEQRAALLRAIVSKRKAVLVVGGTGSGKTTLLSALLAEVAPQERIVAIEDTLELTPHHPHVVNLTTRAANTEGAGEVTIADLVRQSLRMRPDRIVVGEIRGAEVIDLLAALNTGHEGGAGTLHANALQEVPARLEALAALGGLGREALHAQAAAALDVVVVMKRTAGGRRILHQIGVIASTGVPQVVWEHATGPRPGYEELLS